MEPIFLNIHGLHYFLFLYLNEFLKKASKAIKEDFFKHRHNRSKVVDCWPHSFDERIQTIITQNHKDFSYLY